MRCPLSNERREETKRETVRRRKRRRRRRRKMRRRTGELQFDVVVARGGEKHLRVNTYVVIVRS